MEVSIAIGFLLLGMLFGSFYHVVGYRMSKGESFVFPPSHCPNCNHKLGPLELIPVLSFLLQKGKCKECKAKISWFYPIAELLCGILFMLCYLSFGLSLKLLISLTFISMLIIIIFSDIYYMIIEDKVLIFFGILLIIELYFLKGFQGLLYSLLDGAICFVVMLLIKLLGDKMFKKESMGGGDIKLMFIIGLVLGWGLGLINIFVASVIALPISCIILYKNADHVIPFGPFLALGSMILLLSKVDINWIINTIVLR